ncbi:DUF7512 family protein [Natrinema salinisoli]|nr:hypothetical protein [Natrinema salinisoli]
MLAVSDLPAAVEAGVLIGAVLLEAIVLYVGYGLAEQAFGSAVIERLKGV